MGLYMFLLCSSFLAVSFKYCIAFEDSQILRFVQDLYQDHCGINYTCIPYTSLNAQKSDGSSIEDKVCCQTEENWITGGLPSILCDNDTQLLTDSNNTWAESAGAVDRNNGCTERFVIASNNDNKDRQRQNASAYDFVSVCRDDFLNKQIINKCVGTGESVLLDKIPVYSLITFKSYKNIYCLQCNLLFEHPHVFWTVELHFKHESSPYEAKLPELDMYSRIAEANISTFLDIWAKPFDYQFEIIARPKNQTLIPQCDDIYVNHCNVTGRWETYDKLTEEACTRLYLPIVADVDSTKLRYKNLACAVCNAPVDKIVPECTMGQEHTRKQHDVIIELGDDIFDSGRSIIKGISLRKRDKCNEGFIRDIRHKSRICRQVLCPEFMKVHDGHCTPIFPHVRGLAFYTKVGVTTEGSYRTASLENLKSFFFSTVLNNTGFDVHFGSVYTERTFSGNSSTEVSHIIMALILKPDGANTSYWHQIKALARICDYGFTPVVYGPMFEHKMGKHRLSSAHSELISARYAIEYKLPVLSTWDTSRYKLYEYINNTHTNYSAYIPFTLNMFCYRFIISKSEFFIKKSLMYINTEKILSSNNYKVMANGDAKVCISEYMKKRDAPSDNINAPSDNINDPSDNINQVGTTGSDEKPNTSYDDSHELRYMVFIGIFCGAIALASFCAFQNKIKHSQCWRRCRGRQ